MEPSELQSRIEMLNKIYHPLEQKAYQLLMGLNHRIFDPQLTFCSGHRRLGDDGLYHSENYPLPVVSVPGYCDIVVQLDCVIVLAKLRRAAALDKSYEKLSRYEFEAFGVDDYYEPLCLPGMPIDTLKKNIRKSEEDEIVFAFRLDMEIDGDAMYEFVKLLRREGFRD